PQVASTWDGRPRPEDARPPERRTYGALAALADHRGGGRRPHRRRAQRRRLAGGACPARRRQHGPGTRGCVRRDRWTRRPLPRAAEGRPVSGGGEASARMLARIRALLAKAEDPAATRAEAEALFAKAADLMAKYGIDRAMLAASDPSTDRVGDRVFTPEAPYAYDKVLLLNTIAQALGAQAMYKRGPRGEYQLHVFAMGADLERIDLLFTSLLVQATRFMTADLASAVGYRDVKVWKRDWLRGFTAEVWRRLRDAEERARRQAEQE